MNTEGLLLLAQVVLPSDILNRFTITRVESTESDIRIFLDERIDDSILSDPNIESKGFTDSVTVRDFPIRDKGVDLIVRRRRWYNKSTSKSFTLPFDGLKADGVRYSKEFAAFLKEVYGDQTYDLPFA
ncbi:MAG: ISAon1 family transposase N-terminal region protein [Bacteroidales bacterium]